MIYLTAVSINDLAIVSFEFVCDLFNLKEHFENMFEKRKYPSTMSTSTCQTHCIILILFPELVFASNEVRKIVEIDILFDGVKETRETFTVHLRSRSGIVKIEVSRFMCLHFRF